MHEFNDKLVISFLFPPESYVSGITVSKRIIENNEMVDVLQAKSQANSDFNDCIDEFVNERILIDIDCKVDWADCIFKFVKLGINAIEKDYKRIYSRSWLMANHFLACEYKFINPDTTWKAEFSDPLIFDLKKDISKLKKSNKKYEAEIESLKNSNSKSQTMLQHISLLSIWFICLQIK